MNYDEQRKVKRNYNSQNRGEHTICMIITFKQNGGIMMFNCVNYVSVILALTGLLLIICNI